MKTLSLIIPVYNEEKTLENTVNKILALKNDTYIQNNQIEIEIIIVNDASKDGSKKIAQNLCKIDKNIKLFSHEKNKGKGAALKTGFLQAKGDYIGIQDADEEYNPFDYLKLLKNLIENNFDVCYGSRYLEKNTQNGLFLGHTFINKLLTFLTNICTGLNLTDMETCYKLFKSDVIKKITPNLKENCFGFEPEITAYIAKEGYKIQECSINYTPRNYSQGKKIKPKDGIRAIYCIFYYNLHNKNLLKIIATSGIVAFFIIFFLFYFINFAK